MFDEKSDLSDMESRLGESAITQESADTAESAPPGAIVEEQFSQERNEVVESAPPQHSEEQYDEPQASEGWFN